MGADALASCKAEAAKEHRLLQREAEQRARDAEVAAEHDAKSKAAIAEQEAKSAAKKGQNPETAGKEAHQRKFKEVMAAAKQKAIKAREESLKTLYEQKQQAAKRCKAESELVGKKAKSKVEK